MIKRLKINDDGRTHRPQWPDERHGRRDHHLYEARHPFRRMRVMVDYDVLTKHDAPECDLLAGLLQHPLVSSFKYADGELPSPLCQRD
jgi:hypothetical protein